MAFTFTFGGTSYTMAGKHSVREEDGVATVTCPFLITATSEASYITAVQAAYAALGKNNQALVVSQGGTAILTVTHSTATGGFLTRGSVTKGGSRFDTALSGLYVFECAFEMAPSVTARAGRRAATIGIETGPDFLRSVTFAGTWTATAATTGKGDFDTNLAAWLETWLDADNSGGGSPILTTTGRWQRLAHQIEPEDENRRLSFRVTYREVRFTSAPTPSEGLSAGIFVTGSWERVYLDKIAGLPDTALPASMNTGPKPTGGGSYVPGGAGGTTVGPSRVRVKCKAFVLNTVNDPDTSAPYTSQDYWDKVMQPWIKATAASMFGVAAADIIFEQRSFGVEDVSEKSITGTALLLFSTDKILAREEEVSFSNQINETDTVIYSGAEDDYEHTKISRRLMMTHTVTVVQLDTAPATPSLNLLSGWRLRMETENRRVEVLDPQGARRNAFVHSFARTYIRSVPRSPGVKAPQPLGVPSGSKVSDDAAAFKARRA
jgi:hypothetical protein